MMAQSTPVVTRRDIEGAGWLDWLYDSKLFRFQVKGLFVTFRREPQRNGEFWYSYKKVDGRVHKFYVGRSEDITYDVLVETVEKYRYL
jgi:hypothetical protein